ncbi:hypothetical protein COP2_010842 [Malus domestica]
MRSQRGGHQVRVARPLHQKGFVCKLWEPISIRVYNVWSCSDSFWMFKYLICNETEWTRQEDEKLLHLAKLVPEPFLGGDNPEMHPSEFYGVTTRKKEIQTMPTPSATPEVPPKNEYQIVVQPVPEDDDEPEEKTEEDMFDRLAREGAEEEARQQALLRKR